jgi:hypothetical protein
MTVKGGTVVKTPRRSRYDELHDRYHRILTTKSGTRYEHLAAHVFKSLDERHVVIHDLKLAGEAPEVQHQIDVTVEISGNLRRLIIECKDFDISGDKVGLDIIRNFRSVAEDTQADEAIVITCNGFTEDAQKYAHSKNIKLAVLRVFEDRDMAGRIARIIVGVTVAVPSNPRATLEFEPAEAQRFQAELAAIGSLEGFHQNDPVYAVRDGQREQINAFLTAHMNDAIQPGGPKTLKITVPANKWQIQIGANSPIPFNSVVVNFDVDEEEATFDVVSKRVAELILSGFGSGDVIIFGDQIPRFSVDPETGKVI